MPRTPRPRSHYPRHLCLQHGRGCSYWKRGTSQPQPRGRTRAMRAEGLPGLRSLQHTLWCQRRRQGQREGTASTSDHSCEQHANERHSRGAQEAGLSAGPAGGSRDWPTRSPGSLQVGFLHPCSGFAAWGCSQDPPSPPSLPPQSAQAEPSPFGHPLPDRGWLSRQCPWGLGEVFGS